MRRLLVLDRNYYFSVSWVQSVFTIFSPLTINPIDAKVSVTTQSCEDSTHLEGARVKGLHKVKEYSPRAFSGSHSKPAALVGVCRVGHRLFDVDMSPPLKQSVDALTHLGVGGDVEEIGINFVELLFAGGDMEAIG